jgi:diadenosine tetraphosphate (Ap4A) HIT family hydrolase
VIAVPPPAPVAPGHCIVAPRRHVAQFYELDVQEQHAVWGLVRDMRRHLAAGLKVSRFHIGFADFPFEDQGHAHVHVIPCGHGERVDLPRDVEWSRTKRRLSGLQVPDRRSGRADAAPTFQADRGPLALVAGDARASDDIGGRMLTR